MVLSFPPVFCTLSATHELTDDYLANEMPISSRDAALLLPTCKDATERHRSLSMGGYPLIRLSVIYIGRTGTLF
jgi:hypothetical protein